MSEHSFMDYLFFTLFGVLGIIAAGLVLWATWGVYRLICYRSLYGRVQTVTGTVTDMDYTPSRYNPATKTMTSEQNEVYIEAQGIKFEFDDERLYQRCRIADEVTVTYQERYAEARFWSESIKFRDNRVLRVGCPKSLTVEMDDEKPISRKIDLGL